MLEWVGVGGGWGRGGGWVAGQCWRGGGGHSGNGPIVYSYLSLSP